MNDFSELETELRKLRPLAISAELTAKIESAFSHESAVSTPASGILTRPKRLRINWLSLGLGLAAATTFLVLAKIDDNPTTKTPQKSSARKPASSRTAIANAGNLVPIEMTQVVYNARDEGLVFAGGVEKPARRMRYRTQETFQWQEPGSGASLRVSYPSEEVVLTPISGQ